MLIYFDLSSLIRTFVPKLQKGYEYEVTINNDAVGTYCADSFCV